MASIFSYLHINISANQLFAKQFGEVGKVHRYFSIANGTLYFNDRIHFLKNYWQMWTSHNNWFFPHNSQGTHCVGYIFQQCHGL